MLEKIHHFLSKNKTFEIICQVSGSGSWAKVIAGNLRTYNPPALPQDLCSQVSRIVEVIFFSNADALVVSGF